MFLFRKPIIEFLSYYPLKQGLKRSPVPYIQATTSIFILLSIKTRIETTSILRERCICPVFLSYYPLKQGLKRTSS